MQLPPKAEKGKSVIEAWRALEVWARRARLLPGMNTRLAETADGTIVTFAPRVQRFIGAFWVSLADSQGARVGFGTIEGMEPTIAGKAITDPEAVLRLNDGKFDDGGCSWIGLLIEHDEDGKIDVESPETVTVVQRDDFRPRLVAGTHFHPLAVMKKIVLKNGQEIRRLYQIELFHLRASWSAAGKKMLVQPLL